MPEAALQSSTTSDPVRAIKVFVSYTHASTIHSKQVLDLSNALRQAGFDCDIDQYHANQSWPAWMERAIASSKFVLVVCTPTYLRRWNNDEKPGVGLGAQWESLLTRQHLYSSPGTNNKFVPVVFETKDVSSIPTPLADVTRIDLSQADGFKQLCCRLLDIPPAQKPPIRTSLAPVSLADGFFSGENRGAAPQEDHPLGLRDQQETLFSNLFPVAFPAALRHRTPDGKAKGEDARPLFGYLEASQRRWRPAARLLGRKQSPLHIQTIHRQVLAVHHCC